MYSSLGVFFVCVAAMAGNKKPRQTGTGAEVGKLILRPPIQAQGAAGVNVRTAAR
jgi:hypothetical protein